MWWVLFVLFLLISIFSTIALFYALKRINQYENLIISIQKIIELSSDKLNKIDESGHFKSDDEIGFIFDEIKSIQNILNNIFETENNDNGEDDNGKKEN